ncbi:hypothetical protein F4781DRAFT_417163, partial [Annulohypoxylon bovei var. microspora]
MVGKPYKALRQSSYLLLYWVSPSFQLFEAIGLDVTLMISPAIVLLTNLLYASFKAKFLTLPIIFTGICLPSVQVHGQVAVTEQWKCLAFWFCITITEPTDYLD